MHSQSVWLVDLQSKPAHMLKCLCFSDLADVTVLARPQLFKNRITLFTGLVTIQQSLRIPFDTLGEISA